MKHTILLILLFILVSFLSCNNIKKMSLLGKRITFPTEVPFIVYTSGTNFTEGYFSSENLSNGTRFKILCSTDSSGCTGCKMQLDRWKSLMEELLPYTVKFLFFVQPKNIDDFKYIVLNENFQAPLCLDVENVFCNLNPFMVNQVVLLDSDNRIVVIGNPIEDKEVKKEMIDAIRKNEM